MAATKQTTRKTGSRKTAAKKSTAKKSTAKKPTAKKSAAKTSTAKKATAKKATAKKATAKKATAKKAAAKKSTARKGGARKAGARKTAAKQGASSRQYTEPELRERIKARLTRGTKGGKAGQWSARKAQLLAQEYEKAGGGYSGRRTASQRHLADWTEEEWTTADGKRARRTGGTTRYLPKKAWNELSPSEKRATNRKKQEGSRRGQQFVRNTTRAAKAGRRARKDG